MAEAKAWGADLVITQGATQSNHARQTAAFSAKLGMDCHLLLEDRTGYKEENYNHNGNVLLDVLHGATYERRGPGLDMNAEMEAVAQSFLGAGGGVYTIPGGGSNTTGALGYANCALELVGQANDRDLVIDHIVHATGSTGTQAGLITGLKALNAQIPVYGISVRRKETQEKNVLKLAEGTARPRDRQWGRYCRQLRLRGRWLGFTDAGIEAIEMFAKLEGILLDPVYSAKGAAGMIV